MRSLTAPLLLAMCLVSGAPVVHHARAQTSPEVIRDPSRLPEPVARMRQAILSAAMSGDVEAMRVAIDMNELPPSFGAKVADPVAHWRKLSADGEGREILAALVEILRTGFVKKPDGKAGEMFVWPYFAETPLKDLTPGQRVELMTIVPAADAKRMIEAGQYTHWRLGVSSTGVWHVFDKAE
ncbi:MAG: hypothetical protein NW215_15555 [Hyphomicrobiales bacterium]|nr:hypothetical protein [Hyphomicrobiales bacterium]